jgi:hypothetical protein
MQPLAFFLSKTAGRSKPLQLMTQHLKGIVATIPSNPKRQFELVLSRKGLGERTELSHLLLLPRKVPDPPRHVLEPRIPLLRAPHRVCLRTQKAQIGQGSYTNNSGAEKKKRRWGFWFPHQRRTYAKPCLVEVGLVVAGDDLLDEVSCGGEMAALAEQERGAVAADGPLASVEDSVEVTVDPVVVARHLRRRSAPARRSRRDRGNGGGGVEARRREEKTGTERSR